MKITVLNDTNCKEGFNGEWGLSLYIEFKGKKFLFDTGQSALFIENMKKLNLPIDAVEFVILSHAHYDHVNGLKYFFEANKKASVYVSNAYGEYCYKTLKQEGAPQENPLLKYIGPEKGVLEKYNDRIKYVPSISCIDEGICLFPHINLPREDERTIGMYIKKRDILTIDDFSHEQSLLLETPQGIILIEGCSHAGILNILTGVRKAFPYKKIFALIGGFHQIDKTDEQIKELALQLADSEIEYIITGHCTGSIACNNLQKTLQDRFHRLEVGTTFNFPD